MIVRSSLLSFTEGKGAILWREVTSAKEYKQMRPSPLMVSRDKCWAKPFPVASST